MDARRAIGPRLQPGAEPARRALVGEQDRNCKAAGAARARAIGHLRATQPAPWREQRERLDEIGLAGAVLAGQRDEGAVEADVERCIGPEIPQDEAPHPRAAERRERIGAGHGRMSHVSRGGERWAPARKAAWRRPRSQAWWRRSIAWEGKARGGI
jgi:hypothetical protein